MRKTFTKSIPIYGAVVLFLAGGLLSFLIMRLQSRTAQPPISKKGIATSVDCEVMAMRMGGYKFVRPLLYVDKACESPELIGVKAEIEKTIALYAQKDKVTSVSVFLRDFDHSNWVSINDEALYYPGSLYKIPVLFAWLHRADKDPGLLSKTFLFDGIKNGTLPVQNYIPGKSLEKGKYYTLRDLLEIMIVHSDNQAQWLLNQNLPKGAIEQSFVDLGIGIPIPASEDNRIRISARQFSTFMKALVNGSYLSLENSEFALNLLSQCSFQEGMLRGLPAGTKVAHKFGEADNEQIFDLHETAIIYIKNRPYLLTILSRGTERKVLPGLLEAITRTTYNQITNLIP
jgi:beta-lactamase class A